MTTESSTLGQLQSLVRLYDGGFQNPVIERAVNKLVALEVAQTRAELQRLEARLHAYEQRYAMTSAEFYQRFCSGELGDAMDYVEWSVFWDMYQATLRRMEALTRPE